MESSHFLTAVIIFLVAGIMLFVEKRPIRQVAVVVTLMVASWVLYLMVFQNTPPAP